MSGRSIYIDCTQNMAELMSRYPAELTEGVDLHIGDPSPNELQEIVRGYAGVLTWSYGFAKFATSEKRGYASNRRFSRHWRR